MLPYVEPQPPLSAIDRILIVFVVSLSQANLLIHMATGVQRTESSDRRAGRVEGNPSGFGGRDTVDGYSRDFVDEGAQA